MGFAKTPFSYFIHNNQPIPKELQTDEDVYRYVGQQMIDRYRHQKDATDKAMKDLDELGENLPSAIADAVLVDDYDKNKAFDAKLREKLIELQAWDGVEDSMRRAQTAWLYMASYMGSPEDLRAISRDELKYIADSLKDDNGNIDERAMAAFKIAVGKQAKELQVTDHKFWRNFGFGLEDVSERFKDYFERPDEPNQTEERLYGTLLGAIKTSAEAADDASFMAKTLSDFGYMAGEMTPALLASTGAALATGGGSLLVQSVAAAGATSAAVYIPTTNQTIAAAYVEGKKNPELHGSIEGVAEAAVEGIAGTIPGGQLFGKIAGKAFNKAASFAAGSRMLSNSVTQSLVRFFGGAGLQGLGELAEEEASAALGAGLNATFRAAGYDLTPEQYELGKAWGEMESHQVAAMFLYSTSLGVFGLPSNIKAAREYARNSDNLLMVGHSEAAARDITEKQYEADAEKQRIFSSDISIEEKAEKMAEVDDKMDAYLSEVYRKDVLNAKPDEIERRKKRENDNFMLATEAMLYIQNGVAERTLERLGYTASIPQAGNNITLLLENKTESGEVKMEERSVSKKQFARWLMMSRNKELRDSMRNMQSQIAAKKLIESVQSFDDIKHEIINLQDAPAKAITELKTHNAITPETLQVLANHAANEARAHVAKGMSEQQAIMQSSSIFKGVQLRHVIGLVDASKERQQNEASTTSGKVSGITKDSKIEHPAFRLPRMDGTSVIVYAENRAGVNHILEELLESDLSLRLASGTTSIEQLAEELRNLEKQLPGKIHLLPKGKKEYNFGDVMEAYSKIAQANFLYNEAFLPIDKGGHALVRNILTNVKSAQLYKVLGEAYRHFANTDKGKEYLANGGKNLVQIMTEAGFTIGSRFEAIQQEADKAVADMEARNLLPSPKQETEQLIEDAKSQQELAEINDKESAEAIVIPADESITGEEIEVPQNDNLTRDEETPVIEPTPEDTLLAKLRTPKATARDFALYLSDNRGEVVSQGLYSTTQSGKPNPAFVLGELLSRHVPKEELITLSDKELEERLKIAMVDEAIFDAADAYTNSESLKIELSAAKNEFKNAKIKEDIKRKKAESLSSLENGKATTLPPAPKWPTVSNSKQQKQTEQERSANIARAIKSSVSTDSTRPAINHVKHEVKNGRERWASTDGRRLTIVSHTSDAETSENLMSLKTGVEISEDKAKMNFPNIDSIIPVSYKHRDTIDLAPYRALRKYKKNNLSLDVSGNKLSNIIYLPAEQGKNYKPIILSSLYFRDAVEQLAALSKVLGFGSVVHVDYIDDMSPIVFSAEHNGWEWKHVLMPYGISSHAEDIVLSNNPAFFGATEYSESKKTRTDKELQEAEEKTEEARKKVKTLEKKYKDVARLEQDLPEVERQARWYAAQLGHNIRTFHRKRVSDILNKNLTDSLMEALTISHRVNKYSSKLFTRLTGIKLPGTIEGNERAIKEWAPREYAEYKNRSKANNQDSGSFSIDAIGIAERFNSIKNAQPILVDTSSAFQPDIKAAIKSVREAYRELQNNPVTMKDGKRVQFSGNGFHEIKNHAADRRVIAVIPKLKKLCESSEYMYSASNSESNKPQKADISQYHYYLNKASFAGQANDAYILIAIAERTNGDFFYDLDATDIETIDNIKGTTDTLTATRVPNTGQQGGAPKGRLHNLKEVVNNFEQNLPITAEQAESVHVFKDDVLQAENAIITQPGATFSIAPMDNLEERFVGNLLAERMMFYLRREAKRFSRVIGNKTPYETAVNAIASANAVMGMLDKYIHTEKIPLGRDDRRRVQLLQRLIEKYAEIIKVGGKRSFNKISKSEQGVLENILSEISTGIEEGKTKANARERYQELVREAAKGRVWKLLSDMMIEAGDILDAHLKSELLKKMNRITKGVKIKRTPSKRLKGKMTAAGYRDLEQAVKLMALSQRAKQDIEEDIDFSRDFLIRNMGKLPIEKLRKGSELLKELAVHIEKDGRTLTEESLNQELSNYHKAVIVYGDIESKDYAQTKDAANALYELVKYHRSKWQDIQDRKTAKVKAHLRYFLDNTPSKIGRDNFIRKVVNKANSALTFLPDSMMNTAQLFLALSSYKPLQPLFEEIRYSLANAQTAREVHLRNIRERELAEFGRIMGVVPATKAGYTKKQLDKISDMFDAFYQDNNKTHQTDIEVKWVDTDGKQQSEKLEATNWELLGYILNYRQEHYKFNALIHGFTPEVLQKIEEHIGENLMAFGNAIQQIIISDGTTQVYEEREGIPMQENPLYFPGSININTVNTTREEPLAHAYHPAAMHDFLHVRVKHRNEIKGTNAYATYRAAIADRANYILLDPAIEVLTRLLAHMDFSNRLMALIGPNLVSQLKATINEIKGAAYQESSLRDLGDSKLGMAISTSALTALAGNPASIARQFSAVANAGLMPGISPLDLLKYNLITRNGKGHISITEVYKLDAFETRRRDNAFVNEMAAMGNDVKYSTLLNWAKTGMNVMDKMDTLSNAVSAAVVYNHKYDQLKKMGHLTEEQIANRCEEEVNAYVRLLAQPLNKVDKSALYWVLSNKALGRAFLYMSSDAINKLGMLRANYITSRNNGHNAAIAAIGTLTKMGLSVGLANFMMESIISLVTGNTPDDDDSITAWIMSTYLNATIGQYFEVMPVLGTFSKKYLSPYGRISDDRLNIPGSNIDMRVSKLHKMLTDDKDYSGAQWQKEITRFMREFTSMLGYAGGAYSKMQWLSHVGAALHGIVAALNSVYFVSQAATNDAAWTDFLPEDYTTAKTKSGKNSTKKTRRLKSQVEEWLTPKKDSSGKKSKKTKPKSE